MQGANRERWKVLREQAARRSLPTSQILREMAEDYLHLAADADGRIDGLRKRNYKWLVSCQNVSERRKRNRSRTWRRRDTLALSLAIRSRFGWNSSSTTGDNAPEGSRKYFAPDCEDIVGRWV
jgi:hypothetical protein